MGSFGGTYFRPIKSSVTGQSHRDVWKEFPAGEQKEAFFGSFGEQWIDSVMEVNLPKNACLSQPHHDYEMNFLGNFGLC